MDAPGQKAVLKLEAVARALSQLALVGAEAYANGGHRATPIVAAHFTPGNQQRYGWAPLSPSYAARKAAGLVQSAGGYHFLGGKGKAYVDSIRQGQESVRASRAGEDKAIAKMRTKADREHIEYVIAQFAGGRRGSKLDHAQTVRNGRGGSFQAPMLGAANLPMLVLTGKLREAVLSRNHPIRLEGDTALIEFQVPAYAHYLQDGTPKMPRRSPVDPNESDAAQVRAEMQKYLDAQLGTAGRVPVSSASVPGAARAV